MKNEERQRYVIPKNFLDYGYVFGGRFKLRNFVEASVITAPVFGIFLAGWKLLGWSVYNTVAICVILCATVFLTCVNGVAGDSLLEFIVRVNQFKKSKQISKYNPRVKHENEPDYLMVKGDVLPRDKLIKLGKSLANKFIGEDLDAPISKDISDKRLITFFEDDDGIIEKPEPLKSRAELREDAKKAKKEEKERRKEERAYLKTLPPEERRIKKKAMRLEARVRRAEAVRLENEKKIENDRRIKEVLAQAEERKALLYKIKQEEQKQEKEKKKAEQLADKQKKREERLAAKQSRKAEREALRQSRKGKKRNAPEEADTMESLFEPEIVPETPNSSELGSASLPYDEQNLFEDEPAEIEESPDELLHSFEITFFEEQEQDEDEKSVLH